MTFGGTKLDGHLVGGLTFQKGREVFVSTRLSASAVNADGHGHGGDLFRLWIAGVEKTGGSTLTAGDDVVTP